MVHLVKDMKCGKSVKQCVEFYYLWKKVCPDEYKRLRIIRKKREQDDLLYNLRSRVVQVAVITWFSFLFATCGFKLGRMAYTRHKSLLVGQKAKAIQQHYELIYRRTDGLQSFRASERLKTEMIMELLTN